MSSSNSEKQPHIGKRWPGHANRCVSHCATPRRPIQAATQPDGLVTPGQLNAADEPIPVLTAAPVNHPSRPREQASR